MKMHQFNVSTALLAFVIVALVISLVMCRQKHQKIESEFALFREHSVSNEYFGESMIEQDQGMSFILNLLKDRDRHVAALNFIESIDGGIRFGREELQLYDDFEIYRFSEAYRTWDRKIRPDFERRTICFLVDTTNGLVVDELMVIGELYGVVWANLRDAEFQHYVEHTDEKGSEVQYAINRDGFHRIDAEDVLRQDIVHTKAWLAILDAKSGMLAEAEEARKELKELQDGVRKKLRR